MTPSLIFLNIMLNASEFFKVTLNLVNIGVSFEPLESEITLNKGN